MRDGDGKIIKKPFAKFNRTFLMTRWTKMATLAGEGDKVFVAAVVASHTGKTVLQTTAIEIAKDGQPDLGSQILHYISNYKMIEQKVEDITIWGILLYFN